MKHSMYRMVLLSCGTLLGCAGVLCAQADVPACTAADNTVDYGTVLTVPEDTRALIESYRLGWREFCSQKPGGKVTLAELYARGESIRVAFEGVIEQAEKDLEAIPDGAAQHKRTDEMHNALMKSYPTFVPAFEGSLWEQSFFHPLTKGFKPYASRGSREDRLYFEAGMPLSDAPWEQPWIERTWDYGGCYLFGKFDWAAEIQRIARVKRQVKSEVYVKRLADYETSLFFAIEEPGNEICSCDRKDAVLKDYRKISKSVEKESNLSSHLSKVRSATSDIQSGKTKIGSEMEKHCSGG